MRALVTGLGGTVAPALADALRARGHEVLRWDRTRVPPDDPDAARAFVLGSGAEGVFHLATGPAEWAERIARLCAEGGLRLLFTSTVSVFSPAQRGPFSPEDVPEPADDYGRYKLDCERRVRAAHPGAVVVRIGWQIGEAPGGNHMVDFLDRTHRRAGRVEASTRWLPACSFLANTGAALAAMGEGAPGLYHFDSNPGLSFFETASRLNRRHGSRWTVAPTDEPAWDQRLSDPRVQAPSLADRLPGTEEETGLEGGAAPG